MVKASYLLAAPVKSLYSPTGDLEKAGGSFPPHRSLWRDPKDLKHGLATRKLKDATQSAGPRTKLHRGYSKTYMLVKHFLNVLEGHMLNPGQWLSLRRG